MRQTSLQLRSAPQPQGDADSTALAHVQPLGPGLKRKSLDSQPFGTLVVLDLEATCDGQKAIHPQEIIEIGATILDTKTLSLSAEPFQMYVRPTEHRLLTPFCTQLTGIKQAQVDNAQPLERVLAQFQDWLTLQGCFAKASPLQSTQCFALVTWTNWDLQIQLDAELKWREIKKLPWLRRWINLKVAFERHFGKPGRLQDAVVTAGLQWSDGRAHSGLADAINTARLAAKLIQLGEKLNLTGWFDDAAPANRGLKQQTLFGFKPQKRYQTIDSDGKLTGLCCCGKRAQLRTVKRPGVNHGREFWSCGAWHSTGGKTCDFFHWVLPTAPLQT